MKRRCCTVREMTGTTHIAYPGGDREAASTRPPDFDAPAKLHTRYGTTINSLGRGGDDGEESGIRSRYLLAATLAFGVRARIVVPCWLGLFDRCRF